LQLEVRRVLSHLERHRLGGFRLDLPQCCKPILRRAENAIRGRLFDIAGRRN
jgi:hypothetical protein